jgi:hypothetical protein
MAFGETKGKEVIFDASRQIRSTSQQRNQEETKNTKKKRK